MQSQLLSIERLAALRSAAAQHVKYIKSAAKGNVCDRHL